MPPGFQSTVVFSGLTQPTAVRFAPDGRVFVAEKSGLIKVFDSIVDTTPQIFADLSTNVFDGWDRGLLGLAIDPAFPARPYLYVLYTYDAPIGGAPPQWGDQCPDPPGYTDDGCVVSARLSRLQAAGNVMTGPEVVLVEDWCQQYPSHSIGDLHFGVDGALYASAGDGASFNWVDYGQQGNPCGDPVNEGGALRSQDLRTSNDAVTLDGTMIRVDPDTGGALPDNPLYGGPSSGDDRIIAYGLRNPFRFTVRPGTSEVWIGDVGWSTWEEIDRIVNPVDATVENFGWPCYEGSSAQPAYDSGNFPICESLYGSGSATDPYYAYRHQGDSAITGIAFYAGGNYPASYVNALFFADYSAQWINVMPAGGNGLPDPGAVSTFMTTGAVVDLQTGPGGDLYYVDIDLGEVIRIEYFAGNQPPHAVAAADITSGTSPLTVHFDASASSDPDAGDALSYLWDLDGDGSFDDAATVTAQWTYTSPGIYLARLQVFDSHGAKDEDQLVITIDNAPPVPNIIAPDGLSTWHVGDVIAFSGEATDPETGPMPPSTLDWQWIMHHCAEDDPDDCHEHHVQDYHGVASGEFDVPDHEYPAYLELRLTATEPSKLDWWDATWGFRQRITFDNAASAEDLIDFPVLVRLNPGRFDYGNTSPSGADLRFVDGTGTVLAHEIETWNAQGESQVWVRIPRIEAASTGDFVWLYYGNPAAPDGQLPAGVWSPSFAAVWHLGDSLQDSTANSNHGTNLGSTVSSGWIGSARSFDGASYIDAGTSPSLEITGQLTIEAWVQIGNPAANWAMRVVSKKKYWDSHFGYDLEYKPIPDDLTMLGSGDYNWCRASGVDLDGPWHYCVGTINGSAGKLYVNGIDRTTDDTVTALIASGQPFNIGRRSGDGDYWVGGIDEVRIANVARSADWVMAQYRAMNDTFVSFGVPETVQGLSATTSISLFPETSILSFASEPSGLSLVVYESALPTPFDREAIVGARTTVSAPSPQFLNGAWYRFVAWSDGGARTHAIVIGSTPETLTATFARWSATAWPRPMRRFTDPSGSEPQPDRGSVEAGGVNRDEDRRDR